MDNVSEYKNLTIKQKIATALFGVFCFVVLIVCVFQFSNMAPRTDNMVKDSVSGVLYSTYAGQPSAADRILTLGFERVYDKTANGGVYEDMVNDLKHFIIYTETNAKKISYVDNSLKIDGMTTTFEMRTDTNKTFKVECTKNADSKYSLSISNSRGELLSYDSSVFVGETKDPQTLFKKHLPHSGKTASGISYGFTMNSKGEYEISVNSCGDNAIKQEAKNDVEAWLKSLKYNPKDLKIVIPDRCPRR